MFFGYSEDPFTNKPLTIIRTRRFKILNRSAFIVKYRLCQWWEILEFKRSPLCPCIGVDDTGSRFSSAVLSSWGIYPLWCILQGNSVCRILYPKIPHLQHEKKQKHYKQISHDLFITIHCFHKTDTVYRYL